MEEKPLFFIGIDPSQRYHPYVYAALDENLHIQAVGTGPLRDVLAFLAGLDSACVAINGPQMVNQGLLDDDEDTNRLFSVPVSKLGDLRKVEQSLLDEGIQVYRTPAVEANCMMWVKRGFKLFKRILKLGYQPFPHQDKRHFLETPAEAVFGRLIGGNPLFDSLSLEGRIQRQLILYEQGVAVKDAMDFFEEVTRFRLLKGVLPADDIFEPGELNAIGCAYLAWLMHHKPEKVESMGDKREGEIFLPNKQEEISHIRF